MITANDIRILGDLSSMARDLETATQTQANQLRRARQRWLQPYLERLVTDENHWGEVRLAMHRAVEPDLLTLEEDYERAWDRYEQIALILALRDWAHGRYAIFNQSRDGRGFPAITPAIQYLSTRRTLSTEVRDRQIPILNLYLAAYEAGIHIVSRDLYRTAYRGLISLSAKCGDAPQLAPYNMMISLRRIHRAMLTRIGNARCLLTALSSFGVDGRIHRSPATASSPGTGLSHFSTVQQVRDARRQLLRTQLGRPVWPSNERSTSITDFLPKRLNVDDNTPWRELLTASMRNALETTGTNEDDESDLDWLASLYLTYILRGYTTAPQLAAPQRPNPNERRRQERINSGTIRPPENRWVTLIHLIGQFYPRFELAGICDLGVHDRIAPLSTYNGHGYMNYDIDRAQETPVRAVRPRWLRLGPETLGEYSPVTPGIYLIARSQGRARNISPQSEFEAKTELAIFDHRNRFNARWNGWIKRLRNQTSRPSLSPAIAGRLAQYNNPIYEFMTVLLWPQRLAVTGSNTAANGQTDQGTAPVTPGVQPEQLDAETRNSLRGVLTPPERPAMFFFGLFDLFPIDGPRPRDLHQIQRHAWQSLRTVFVSAGSQYEALWNLLAQMPAPPPPGTLPSMPSMNRPSSLWIIQALNQRRIPLAVAAGAWRGRLDSHEPPERILEEASAGFERRLREVVATDPLASDTSSPVSSIQLRTASLIFYNWLATRLGMTGRVASGIDLVRDRPIPTMDDEGEPRGSTPGQWDVGGSEVPVVHDYLRIADLDGRPVSNGQHIFLFIAYRHLSLARDINNAEDLGSETAPMIGLVGMTGNPVTPHVHMQLELHVQDPRNRRTPTPPVATFSPAEIFLPIAELRMPGHGPHLPYHDIAITQNPVSGITSGH